MDKEDDILSAIKQFNPVNPNVKEENNKNSVSESSDRIEVEYSYVDFTWMLIGEKIRSVIAGEPKKKFNDFYYSKLVELDNPDAKLAFFGQGTIVNLINSQWRTTQDVQQLIFQIYLVLFVVPMCISSFRISNEVDSLMFFIATLPAVILLAIEIVQMIQMGPAYLTAEWNMLDIS
jgi:hypothetical protein